jgi:GTP pyrophosphokinase
MDAITKKLKDSKSTLRCYGREKHLYSIYRKMREKHLSFAQVLDVFAFRVIVNDVPVVLSRARRAARPLQADTRASSRTTSRSRRRTATSRCTRRCFGPFGSPIEIQIRTREMHKIAEAGVASHWLYRSSDASLSELQQKTHQWLQSLIEMQSKPGDSVEFLEHSRSTSSRRGLRLHAQGQIMSLPRGATAVDFAYAVHTDIGNRCVAVKINQELMPLRTELKNGDRVEIITARHAKPNPLWLNFVVTAKARSRIRHFVKTMHFHESAQLG